MPDRRAPPPSPQLGSAEGSVQQKCHVMSLVEVTSCHRLTGARVLAEIGDDRSRFADAKALKAYAGAAPVTRAS
ncbi:transposase, partial [Streptomyces sp.]